MEQDSSQRGTAKEQERIQVAKREIPIKHELKIHSEVYQTDCQINCVTSILGDSEFS